MRRLRGWVIACYSVPLILAACNQPTAQPVPAFTSTPAPTVSSQATREVTAIPTRASPVSGQATRPATAPAAAPSESLPAPTSSAPTDWQTFTSPDWPVALDYPPDWSVDAGAAAVTFSSPPGGGVQLTRVDTQGLPPETFLAETQLPNTRCSAATNAYDVAVRTCLDTLARTQIAYFILQPAQGPPQLLALTLLKGGDRQVFQRMIASIRPSLP